MNLVFGTQIHHVLVCRSVVHGDLSVPDNYVLDILPYVTPLTIQIFKINPCIFDAEIYESCLLLNIHSQEARLQM